MGREIVGPEEGQKVTDITKPWRKKFFEVKIIGKEPPMSQGFWKKPKHGVSIKEK